MRPQPQRPSVSVPRRPVAAWLTWCARGPAVLMNTSPPRSAWARVHSAPLTWAPERCGHSTAMAGPSRVTMIGAAPAPASRPAASGRATMTGTRATTSASSSPRPSATVRSIPKIMVMGSRRAYMPLRNASNA